MTYSLLEFYNSLSEVNPKFYDEKFARIMCTSFIGTEKVAKSFQYNPKHEVVLFMKGMAFSDYEYFQSNFTIPHFQIYSTFVLVAMKDELFGLIASSKSISKKQNYALL